MTAPSVVNYYHTVTSPVSITATGAGNLLVAWATSNTLAGVVAPKVGSTSFNQDVAPFGTSSSYGGLYSYAPPTGTTSVTFAGSGNILDLYELAPGTSWPAGPFDVSATATGGTGTNPAAGPTSVTAVASEVVLGLVREDGSTTYTVGGAFILDHGSSSNTAAAHLITSSTGTQSVSFTAATQYSWACIVAAYKPSAIVTSTRQVPDQAALSLTSKRLVPNKAALVYSPIRSIPNGAALQGSFRRTVPNKAALIETSMRSVPNQAALTHTAVRSVPNRAELIGSIVRSIPNRAALINTASRSIPNQAELADEHIRRIPNKVFLYTPIPPDGRDMTRPVESPSRRNIWKG